MSASSSSRIFAQHVRVSSTDELSYDASTRGEINETIQTIVTGRKCWKTMKGKGEVVWPPFLELALVEGTCPSARKCIYARCSPKQLLVRPREVPTCREPDDACVWPLPDAEQVHLGLHLQQDRQASHT